MYRFLLFFCVSFYTSFVFAQNPVAIKQNPLFAKDQTIEINSYYKGKQKLIKSIKLTTRDSVLVSEFKDAGLYFINIKGIKNKAEFIYNPNERMSLELEPDLANGVISIENSKDNIAYSDLLKINNAYDHFLDSIQTTRRELHYTTEDFYGRCFFLDSLYEVVAAEKNERLTFLQFSYPSTYTSEVLAPLSLIPIAMFYEKRKYQTPDAFQSKFYFKYTKADNRLLYHYALEDKLLKLVSDYTFPTTDGIKKSIDYITETFKADTAISSYVSSFLIKTFLDAKSPDLALYVMSNSTEGCSFDLGDKQVEYLNNYTHVQLGNQVDDIVLNDVTGTPVSLSNTCKKTDLNILIFWTSWCVHCKKILPELKTILTNYKGKVNVFAVSLDEDKEAWADFVTKNELTSWVHVSELKPIAKSTLAPRFMVTHTPTIYLLDKDRKIVAKNLNKDQLISELQNRVK